MSYIGRCQLSGYKSIKNVSCEFNKGLNIIIGNNGSGKTNLLEFIYKILRRDYSGLDVFNADIQVVDDLEIFEWVAKGQTITDKNNHFGKILTLNIVEPDKNRDVYIEFVKFKLPNEVPILSSEYNPKYNIKDKRIVFDNTEVDKIPVVLFYWLASTINELKKVNNKITGDYLYSLITKSFADSDLSSYLKNLLQLYTPVEDIRFSNTIRVTNIDSSILEFRNIILEYKINEQWFPFNALSDGTKRLVYTILQIQGVEKYLQMGVNLVPIALIEEPEIGIHPHQLHLLMTFLKERAEQQQIIITTHSPQVLDVLSRDELDNIFIAEINNEKGTTLRKLTEKETEKAKYYLENEGMLSDYWRFSDLQRSKESK